MLQILRGSDYLKVSELNVGREIYTVGHSNRKIADFLTLLRASQIDAVADVRSTPYSRTNAQYDRESLIEQLAKINIKYVFLGRELGGRPPERSCYRDHGKVDYEKVACTTSFQEGLNRLEIGLQRNYRIALTCSEKDPLRCHRAILIGRRLVERQIRVHHIIDHDCVETHDATAARLIKLLRISEIYESRPIAEQIELAYTIQGDNIAFERQPRSPDPHRALPLT